MASDFLLLTKHPRQQGIWVPINKKVIYRWCCTSSVHQFKRYVEVSIELLYYYYVAPPPADVPCFWNVDSSVVRLDELLYIALCNCEQGAISSLFSDGAKGVPGVCIGMPIYVIKNLQYCIHCTVYISFITPWAHHCALTHSEFEISIRPPCPSTTTIGCGTAVDDDLA